MAKGRRARRLGRRGTRHAAGEGLLEHSRSRGLAAGRLARRQRRAESISWLVPHQPASWRPCPLGQSSLVLVLVSPPRVTWQRCVCGVALSGCRVWPAGVTCARWRPTFQLAAPHRQQSHHQRRDDDDTTHTTESDEKARREGTPTGGRGTPSGGLVASGRASSRTFYGSVAWMRVLMSLPAAAGGTTRMQVGPAQLNEKERVSRGHPRLVASSARPSAAGR